MKQIDIIKTYSQKRCLVVDDVPDIRTALKRNLVDFGAEEVDTAGTAEEAIEICQRHRFDIVLSDYNLGTGKSGQQLLEELRFHGLLKNTALYIMITAESAIQSVLHTLEYQPDDYLSKPITRESLRPRLDQALLKNESLMPIKQALDDKKPNSAIAACQKLLAAKTKYSSDVKKIYGELLLKQKQYDQALELYKANLEPLWSQVGLAKTYYLTKEYAKAKSLLEKIIESHQYCVEAHDLLARVYNEKGKSARAQQALSVAINLSPNSVDRQREMGKISATAGDLNASTHAFRSALKLSKNSCHESPEDYINLSQSLSTLAAKNPDAIDKLAKEAMETLRQLDKKYGKQPIYKMRSKLIEGDFHELNQNLDSAERVRSEALDIHSTMKYSVVANTPTEVCLECAKAFMARGKYDEGEKLLQEIAKANEDDAYRIEIDKLLREPVTKEGIQYATLENKQGIQLYQKQDYPGAIKAFEHVLKELPNHIGLNMNLIQAIVSKAKAAKLEEREYFQVSMCLQRIGKLESDSKHSERLEYLKRQINKLKKDIKL